jgi:magnesium chelatase subunit H
MVEGMDEAAFSALGRNDPKLMKRLMASVSADTPTWMSFQKTAQDLSLRRSRDKAATEQLKKQFDLAVRREREVLLQEEEGDAGEAGVPKLRAGEKAAKIVLVSGFESFNVKLYRKVSKDLKRKFPGLNLIVFSDRDITSQVCID